MLIFYTMNIAEALHSVQEKVKKAALNSGRDPDEIKIVAVSKTVSLEKIIEAVNAGASILGENRVQEAKGKITELKTQKTDLKPEWHLIGSLQKNKAKTAIQLFDLIHSVDSIALAQELNRHAGNIGKVQSVLVQVKLSDETTKHGVSAAGVMELLEKVYEMDYLRLEGLMTIPPFFEDPEYTRPYFKWLRELFEKARANGFRIHELSMGMSNDFEVAIEEGSTMVRVGTAIFGERTY
jgi:pyridoxal phosphate enzyme (YggS family)